MAGFRTKATVSPESTASDNAPGTSAHDGTPANDDGLPLARRMLIQVMRFEPYQPIFGFITREHLTLYQIPPQAFQPLYGAWLRLLDIHDETGTVTSVWTDGDALHAALSPIHDDLDRLTCLRWSLMMNAIGLNAVIERDVRDGR